MEYPKIETLYERDEATFRVTSILSRAEFLIPKTWLVTEKIDGVNVRVHFQCAVDNGVQGRPAMRTIHGRTDNGQLHPLLRTVVENALTIDKLQAAFPDADDVWLFGEGYGTKIESGGSYAPDQRFRLFDVRVGEWWLNWNNVCDVARKLDIATVPLIADPMSLEHAVNMVKNDYTSHVAWSDSEQRRAAEGIVCRTDPLLMLRNGERLMWKLKRKDYTGGKKH